MIFRVWEEENVFTEKLRIIELIVIFVIMIKLASDI